MAKKKVPNLVVERAEDQGNYFYLSVLEFRKENYLVIVDNITEDGIGAYVLDFAQQEGIDLKQFISVVTSWFYRGSFKYPLSFEFSRLGMAMHTNRIHKNFELAHVTRLIGNDFRYDLTAPPKIKRRRVSMIPAGVEIKLRKSSSNLQSLQSQPTES
jgi:hypothetical protein